MKVKRKNIIMNFAQSIVLKRYVLILFILHLVLAHVVLQNYFLCFEKDGGVVLESFSDKSDCCDSSIPLMNAELSEVNSDEDCRFCEDFAVSENCTAEFSLAAKKLKPIPPILLLFTFTSLLSEDRHKECSTITNNENEYSHQLDSYKTVLLLI